MARPNDRFWDFVEKLDDGRFNCTFCGYKFAAATSVSRIKWHLSGVRGHGVAICDKVTEDVHEAAFQATHGGNKRHKSIASSSNVNDNVISTTRQEQKNNEADNLAGDAGRIQAPVTMVQAIGTFLEEITNVMEDDIENGTGGVVHPGAGASSSGGLTGNTNETPGDAVPTTKLVGQAFKDHKKTIWSWLLVTHIYNQLLARPETHVYWLNVSHHSTRHFISMLIGYE